MAAKNVSKRQVSRRQMRMALSIFGCEFSPKSTHGNLHSVSFSRVKLVWTEFTAGGGWRWILAWMWGPL